MRILIVEDEARIASLVKQGLEENGFEAMIAYDGLNPLNMSNIGYKTTA